MLTVKVTDRISVENGTLRLDGTPLGTYTIDRVLKGKGKALVFAGLHRKDGPCVVKVLVGSGAGWRNRFIRGMSEVTRLNRVACAFIPKPFDATSVGDAFCFSMELVEGETLQKLLKAPMSDRFRWELAQQYVLALMSCGDIIHPDPHDRNVIVSRVTGQGRASPSLKLIDFGHGWPLVNRPTGRRYRIIREVLRNILRPLPGYATQRKHFAKGTRSQLADWVRVVVDLEPAVTAEHDQ